MTAKQQPVADLSMLDMSIDDIDDLPGFAVPPNGTYSFNFSTKVKVVNKKSCVEASFEVLEILELNDPPAEGDEPDPASKTGTKFSMLFQLGNEVAEGKMKEIMLPIAAHFGERNMLKLITDTCKEGNNVIIAAKVKRRPDPNDEDKVYAQVSNVVVS